MKFVTLNVWSGFNYRGKFRLGTFETEEARRAREEKLIAGLKEEDADVMFLNEVNPVPRQLNRLRQELRADAYARIGVSGVKIGWIGFPINLREADVILARPDLKMKAAGRVHLAGKGFVSDYASFHFGNLTQAVAVSLEIGGGRRLTAVAVHWLACPEWKGGAKDATALAAVASRRGFGLEQIKAAREKMEEDVRLKRQEASRLLEFIEKIVPADGPVVIGGDFNAGPDWESVRMMEAAGFTDAFAAAGAGEGFTWDPFRNANISRYYSEEAELKKPRLYDTYHDIDELIPRRIDYLWARGFQKIESCRLCFDGGEGFPASDHFGVAAEIEF